MTHLVSIRKARVFWQRNVLGRDARIFTRRAVKRSAPGLSLVLGELSQTMVLSACFIQMVAGTAQSALQSTPLIVKDVIQVRIFLRKYGVLKHCSGCGALQASKLLAMTDFINQVDRHGFAKQSSQSEVT
jgi:hypothetical protein